MTVQILVVDVYAEDEDFPAVRHEFAARTREEARARFEEHQRRDGFLRHCLTAGCAQVFWDSIASNGEQLPGGLASGKKPEDFDPDQLRMGVQVEMEHTDDACVAQEIAMDHLTEDPTYYDKLARAGL